MIRPPYWCCRDDVNQPPSILPRKVTFSGDVIVDENGSPQLLLETGTEDSAATFYTGNETSVLTFRSTVKVRFLRGLVIEPALHSKAQLSCTSKACEIKLLRRRQCFFSSGHATRWKKRRDTWLVVSCRTMKTHAISARETYDKVEILEGCNGNIDKPS